LRAIEFVVTISSLSATNLILSSNSNQTTILKNLALLINNLTNRIQFLSYSEMVINKINQFELHLLDDKDQNSLFSITMCQTSKLRESLKPALPGQAKSNAKVDPKRGWWRIL
jgi:hypothetical protein